MYESKDVFYVISIILSFFLGIVNIYMNYKNTNKTRFINTITSERIKWINALRKDISKFCGITHNFALRCYNDNSDRDDVLKELDILIEFIKLNLNPQGQRDKKIQELIEQIPDLVSNDTYEELRAKIKEIITESQEYLKSEWESVKREAVTGNTDKGLRCSFRLCSNKKDQF